MLTISCPSIILYSSFYYILVKLILTTCTPFSFPSDISIFVYHFLYTLCLFLVPRSIQRIRLLCAKFNVEFQDWGSEDSSNLYVTVIAQNLKNHLTTIFYIFVHINEYFVKYKRSIAKSLLNYTLSKKVFRIKFCPIFVPCCIQLRI